MGLCGSERCRTCFLVLVRHGGEGVREGGSAGKEVDVSRDISASED